MHITSSARQVGESVERLVREAGFGDEAQLATKGSRC